MNTVSFDYGTTEIDIILPSWVHYDVLEAIPLASVPLRRAFESAWAQPFGMTDPASTLESGDRVVIVVNDHTRPTPTRTLLALLWERIKSRVDAADVTLLIGTGTHRSPTAQELEAMLGEFLALFHVQIHNCDQDCVDIGLTARGARLLLNRSIVEADRVILIGHIGMHYYAGYTGGRKGILPGVAGRETIEANHAQLMNPRSQACCYDGNPISEEMVDAAHRVPIAFAIDVILTASGEVAKIVLGEPEKAHAAGRAFWDQRFQVPFAQPYDVVLASAGGHPKDINLYQAYKAQYNALRTVEDGGFLFLLAACPDGIGHPVFKNWIERSAKPDDVDRIYEHEGFVLGGHKALYHAHDAKRVSIHLCSEMDDATVRQFFMQPARDAVSILDAARAKFGETLRVLTIPHAADVFPVSSHAK